MISEDKASDFGLTHSTEKETINLWVAFAGHCDGEKLTDDAVDLDAALGSAFTLVRDGAHLAVGQDFGLNLTLMTGYAPGADLRASEVWAREAFGHQRIVFPFGSGNDIDTLTASTDNPHGETFNADLQSTNVADLPDGFTYTILDGANCDIEPIPRSAHLDQARFLVRHCEVLVVVWDGKPPSGAGGTADTVRLALTRGIPIIWINSLTREVRLIDPANLLDDTSLLEICDAVAAAKLGEGGALDALASIVDHTTVATLANRLAPRLLPPWLIDSDAEAHHHDPDLHATPTSWHHNVLSAFGLVEPIQIHHGAKSELERERKSYDIWQKEAQKVAAKIEAHKPNTYESKWAWLYTLWRNGQARPWRIFGLVWPTLDWLFPKPIAQKMEVTKPKLPEALERAYELSDKIALIASSRNRLFQIALLYFAATAVVVGVAPVLGKALYKDPDHMIKFICVTIEFFLLIVMSGLWYFERRAERHLLWSDARRLAERLRAVQATWALGVDAADSRVAPFGTWSEWYVQNLIRSLGPPKGHMYCDRLLEAAKYGGDVLINSQVNYHRTTHKRMHAIHSRIETFELIALFGLMATLFMFIVWHLVDLSQTKHIGAHAEYPTPTFFDVYGAILLMTSAIVPALSAVSIALESQLEISATARRSAALQPRFEALSRELAEALPTADTGKPSPARATEILRDAAKLLVSDVDSWRNDLERRRIIRGP
jgi:hypothetical protein